MPGFWKEFNGKTDDRWFVFTNSFYWMGWENKLDFLVTKRFFAFLRARSFELKAKTTVIYTWYPLLTIQRYFINKQRTMLKEFWANFKPKHIASCAILEENLFPAEILDKRFVFWSGDLVFTISFPSTHKRKKYPKSTKYPTGKCNNNNNRSDVWQ